MATDIEIAQAARLLPIEEIAARLGLQRDDVEPYGHYKGKLTFEAQARLAGRPEGRLVLVTAMSPTPAGEGKTTTTVGLGDAFNRIGRRAVICLREPSLGPVFGMKGGAAGGGRAQVVPMEDINLHFTGDFAAIASAHNLLSALIDNHVHHGNELGLDVRRIAWKRVVDMNDRALRQITVGLGGAANGYPREDGFDIVVASEVMAIFCLADSLQDLKLRLGAIVVGRTRERAPVHARDLGAAGAMAALLRDAIKPNLVQTLENNPALIHGGPFGNIAHGCNSVLATRAALRLGDLVVTEAGFGADLGAEKFIDIKCRRSGIRPDAAVIVATVRALKYHGGVALGELGRENTAALERGLANLERHVHNVRTHYGLPCVVGLNHFDSDTAAEIEQVERRTAQWGVRMVVARHWAEGSAGAEPLARAVLDAMERQPARLHFVYDDGQPLWDKIERIARTLYGADGADADDRVRAKLAEFEAEGHGGLPVCIAKTPYSFSSDATRLGAATGHRLQVRDVRLAAGAGFVVVLCGEVMTMPGLPRVPSSARIDVDAQGRITGLF